MNEGTLPAVVAVVLHIGHTPVVRASGGTAATEEFKVMPDGVFAIVEGGPYVIVA